MSLLAGGRILEFLRSNISVEDVLPHGRDSIPWMFVFFSFFNRHEASVYKLSKSVTRIPTREIGIVGNVASAEGQAVVKHAKDGEVRGLHPIDLAMHNRSVKSDGLYMTGLYAASHGIASHRLRYRELDISSCGIDTVSNDHALGLQDAPNSESPGLPNQREPGAWSKKFRMYTYEFNRLKTQGGMTAAQTPSKRPHRNSLGGCGGVGAGATAANHAHTTRPGLGHGGGGQHAGV